jgi:hypothetical protein
MQPGPVFQLKVFLIGQSEEDDIQSGKFRRLDFMNQMTLETYSDWNKDHWSRGRCYDHNFLRFLPIFSEIFGSLLKTNVMIKFFNSFALF